LLFAICAYAVRKGLLLTNPCADTQLPQRTAYDEDGEPIVCFLERAEFELIAETMCAATAYEWRPKGGRGKRRPNSQIQTCGIGFREDRDLITLAVQTGLRWGEISALRVGDVDLQSRRLAVKRAW
jgi:integrase